MAGNAAASPNPRVILVGVGGATCSGKTTLAKHLKRILPDSVIIHQDDFAPPQELVPIHLIHKVQDWDAAPGAIVWPKLVSFLREVKETGTIPPEHRSHDHLNEQKEVKLDDEVRDYWIEVFDRLRKERETEGKEKIVWGLVDGFLLYWNQEVIDQLDVRIFLRVPEEVLRKRRHERHGYHTAVPNHYPISARANSARSTSTAAHLECNLIQREHYGETRQATGNTSYTPRMSMRIAMCLPTGTWRQGRLETRWRA